MLVVRPDIKSGMDLRAWMQAFAAKLFKGGSGLMRMSTESGASSPAGIGELAARGVVNALFRELYDCGVERRGMVRPLGQLLVLVIDGLDIVSPTVVRWFADDLLPKLDEVRSYIDYVVVLVGEVPLANQLAPVAWGALPMRFLPVEIPPMSESESVELLSLYARRSPEAKICHAIAEGIPGTMLEMLRHRIRPLDEAVAALDGCPTAEAEALLAVAGLGYATAEGLRLVLGSDAANAVEKTISGGPPLPVFGSIREGGLWMPGALGRILKDKMGGRARALLVKAEAAGKVIDGLACHFVSETERSMASRLGLLGHIDTALLTSCFGKEEGDELAAFVRSHPEAYEITECGGYRLGEELRSLVAEYSGLEGSPERPALREKVSRLWNERVEELKKEREAAETGVARIEQERNNLLAELDTARGQIGVRMQEHHNEVRERISDDVVRLGASMLANGLGVACIWIALLLAHQRATFLILGTVLIGIGIGTPALKRSRAATRAAQSANNRRKHEIRVKQAHGVVGIIETKINSMQSTLALERRRLDKIVAALDSPYLAE
jgi:hypothetical protein